MSCNQSFFEAMHCSSFGLPSFNRGIRPDAPVNYFAEANGASAIDDTIKLSGAVVTDKSALRRTPHGYTFASTSTADLIVIGFVKEDHNFTIYSYLYSF